MELKEIPFKAWKLTPSGRPTQVEVVDVSSGTSLTQGWVALKTRSFIRLRDLYETKSEAIAAGFNDCDRRQKEINKTQRRLKKRIEVLRQAAASLPT